MINPIANAVEVATSNGIDFELTVTLTNGQTFRGEAGLSGELFVDDANYDTRHIFINPDHVLHVEVHYMA